MSKNLVRYVTYELDVEGKETGQLIKLRKWSIGKLYSMLDAISVVLQKIDINFGGKEYNSQDIGRVISAATEAASAQLTFIIEESIAKESKITADDINEWMPEDYVNVLSKILRMNLTSQLVKNLGSLRTAFNQQENK